MRGNSSRSIQIPARRSIQIPAHKKTLIDGVIRSASPSCEQDPIHCRPAASGQRSDLARRACARCCPGRRRVAGGSSIPCGSDSSAGAEETNRVKRGRMRTASAVTPSARRMAAVGAVAFGVAGLGASAARGATTYGPQKTLATNIQAAAVGVDTTGNVFVSETSIGNYYGSYTAQQIFEIPATGTNEYAKLWEGAQDLPAGEIAVDQSGNLYYADSVGLVQEVLPAYRRCRPAPIRIRHRSPSTSATTPTSPRAESRSTPPATCSPAT